MEKVSSDSLAIDRKSRARLPTLDIMHREAKERVCDFDDICIPMSNEEAMFEASRCVHCPEPAPCVEACPMKAIKFVTETPNQEETDGYNVNLRNDHWLKLGLVDDSRVVPPGGMGMMGGAPKSKPAAKPKE